MTESATSTPTQLSVALTWMPVQLVLLFVALAALDLACQVLGALLVHYVPALVRDAARLGSGMLAHVSWQTRQSALTSGCDLARRMLLCAH